jgi:hypothetical protein
LIAKKVVNNEREGRRLKNENDETQAGLRSAMMSIFSPVLLEIGDTNNQKSQE